METDVSLLYGGQQKNMGIRWMRKVKQIEENDVKKSTLVAIIIKWSKNKNRRRGKSGIRMRIRRRNREITLIEEHVRNINMVIRLPCGQSVFGGNADNVIPVMGLVILLPCDQSISCDNDDNLITVVRMAMRLPCGQSIFSGNADNVIPLL